MPLSRVSVRTLEAWCAGFHLEGKRMIFDPDAQHDLRGVFLLVPLGILAAAPDVARLCLDTRWQGANQAGWMLARGGQKVNFT